MKEIDNWKLTKPASQPSFYYNLILSKYDKEIEMCLTIKTIIKFNKRLKIKLRENRKQDKYKQLKRRSLI